MKRKVKQTLACCLAAVMLTMTCTPVWAETLATSEATTTTSQAPDDGTSTTEDESSEMPTSEPLESSKDSIEEEEDVSEATVVTSEAESNSENASKVDLASALEIGSSAILGTTSDGFTIDNGVLTRYTGDGGDIVIPDTVTSIGDRAFSDCDNITSITISNTVSSIGKWAFYNCNNLINVTLPNSVTSIGEGAFSGCGSLTNITIPNSVTSLGQSVFRGCVNLDNIVIPGSVKKIGLFVFENCTSLSNITISNGVETVSLWAFANCEQLTLLKIPASVTNIELPYHGKASAYEDTSNIAKFMVSEQNQNYSSEDGVLFSKDGKTLIRYPVSKSKQEYIVPDGVTNIGQGAFACCKGTSRVVISRTVENIGSNAFSSTTSIKAIKILSNSIIHINEYAFSGCSGLTSINIPNTVMSIGEYAFSGCSGLRSIDIPNGVISIGKYAFHSTSLGDITIPDSVTSIEDGAFSDCNELYNITLSKNITSIPNSMFWLCNSLSKVIIPDSVVEIYGLAFEGCYNLADITFPDGITKIECNLRHTAWYKNQPDGILYIGKVLYGYKGDGKSVTEIQVKENTVSIEGGFGNCENLKRIIIPASVIDISERAFGGCTNLTIYSPTGSYAQTYAQEKGIPWKASEALTPLAVSSFTTNKGTSALKGTVVTLTAKAEGGGGSYQYRFVQQTGTDTWKVLQDYSSKNTVTWTANPVGTTTLYACVKDSFGKIVKKPLAFTVMSESEPLAIASFTTNKGASAPKGTAVTLTATGAGGTGSYQYRFTQLAGTDTWTILQDYSSKNTVTWTANPVGKSTLYACIKDSTGKIVKKTLMFTVTDMSEPLTVASFATNKGTSASKGTAVTLATAGAGGTGFYQYRFVQQIGTDTWNIIQDYSSMDTATWIANPVGMSTLYACVKDSSGKIVKKTLTFTVTNASEPLAVASFTTNKGTSVSKGTVVMLTATGTGGTGFYQYRFVQQIGTDTWNIIRDYSNMDTATWIANSAGTSTLYACVKDSSGKIVKKALTFTVTNASEPLAITSFTTNKGTSVSKGTTVMLTATGAGGTGFYQYRFVQQTRTDTWTVLQDYSSKNTAAWKANSVDVSTLYACIKDSSGKIVKKSLKFTVGELQ